MNHVRTNGCSSRDITSASTESPSEVVADSEPEKLNKSRKDDTEVTLMTLRRFSASLMGKNERLSCTAKKMFRLFKFLETQLKHSSEKVRYLALEVLCFTVPRLRAKADRLLKPIIPKVIKCLRENEEKDIKLKALHFLRGYFRHSESFTDFVQNFAKIGLNNEDPEIRISCFRGLSIIFDQDIGNDLFSHLVVAIGNQLLRNSSFVIRTAYRALKHIHNTIGSERFTVLINLAEPEAVQIYRSIYNFEESDSFLSLKDVDCSALLTAYVAKRRKLHFVKDFGIFDHGLIDQILKTRNCERAKAVGILAVAFKETFWTDSDLDQHVIDFLKLLISFICDSNRLIQMYGFDILNEVIKKMGFILSPHISVIVHTLREALASANSKIQFKAEKVLYKLMRHTHPMTVVWELLNTRRSSQKEAVLILVQEKVRYFPYHELDMVPLCNFVARSLEDRNCNVSKQSRACMRQLLGILHDCPIYGSWSEAVKTILRNYKFSRETLKDIGVYEYKRENNVEIFEFSSGGDTPDLSTAESFLENSESSATLEIYSQDDPSTCSRCSTIDTFEDESEISTCNEFVDDAPGQLSNSNNTNLNLKPGRKFLSDFNWRRPQSSHAEDSSEYSRCSTVNTFKDVPETSTCKIEFVENAPGYLNKCNKVNLILKPGRKFLSDFNIRRPPSTVSVLTLNKRCNKNVGTLLYSSGTVDEENRLSHDPNSKNKQRTRFCLKNESVDDSKQYLPDIKAGGDSEIGNPSNILFNEEKEPEIVDERAFITESYEQDGIQVDALRKDIFNFNIMTIEHNEMSDGIEEVDYTCCEDYKRSVSKLPLNKKVLNSVTPENSETAKIIEDCRSSFAQNSMTSDTPIFSTTPFAPNPNLTSIEQFTDTIACTPTADRDSSKSISDIHTVLSTPFTNSVQHTSVRNAVSITPIDEMYAPIPSANAVPYTAVSSTISSTTTVNSEIQSRVNNEVSLSEVKHSSSSVSASETVFTEFYEPQLKHQLIEHLETDNCDPKNNGSTKIKNKRKAFENPIVVRRTVDSNNGSSTSGIALSSGHTRSENVINTEARKHHRTANCSKKKVEKILNKKDSESRCNEIFETNTPFVPKSRQLPRTPIGIQNHSSEVQPKVTMNRKRLPGTSKRNKARQKVCEKAIGDPENCIEESVKLLGNLPDNNSTRKPDEKDCSLRESLISSKFNSPSNWGGCQWRRDLDYAARGATCAWADEFEEMIKSVGPYPSPESAENEMKKAVEELFEGSWTAKEEAMLKVIRLANHHPQLVYDNASKIAVVLSNEIKNFRQSVAGKAILTVGHLYEKMGKHFESKLRLVVGALLGKSGTRTLAAYYRLVIKSLAKITNAASPQKAVNAFIQESSRQANKSARETAAQFICVLTESLGPENCMVPHLSSNILKCAGMFVFDSSALTRYCGKRIFDILRKHPDFEKLKDHHLDVTTAQNLNKLLDQIKTKGVSNEILPINLID